MKKRVQKLGGQAAQKVLNNPRAMGAVIAAVTRAQSAKQSFNHAQDALLHQLSFAARGDYQALGKRLSGLKRKVKDLSAKVIARAR